jgi:hypothetical protein
MSRREEDGWLSVAAVVVLLALCLALALMLVIR